MDSSPTAEINASESKRLLSLDFFRGITIAAMILVNNPGNWSHVYPPLLHAQWHGWTLTDLIFPFFLFIVGVSITLAFSTKKENKVPTRELYPKIIRRTLILFALGLFLNGFPFFDVPAIGIPLDTLTNQTPFDITTMRIPGVLQRIAVCYLVASLLFLHCGAKVQALWAVAFMLIYWAAMQWFPVPGIGAGSYAKGANFSAWVDNLVLHGHMWSQSKTWDPEGIFSTLPAISTTLFGVLTGQLLRQNLPPMKKLLIMLIGGGTAIGIGFIWNHWLPINKSLWTSSYALLMSGMALVVLGVSYYLIDIKGWRFGVKPFRIYGMNAITVFVLSGVVTRLLYLIKWQTAGDVITLKEWLVSTFFLTWLSPVNASLGFAMGFVLISYIAMLYLYNKQIFIKI